eukprot:TRINITY_DN26268_c0_g1_i1.p1 TRINITY_DN26268_c0_g1~~TRINITY_DN26268_c0_g1_i1.p1  ORF type:complete len:410 (-),score=37.07 TRINITY_DN26268_c0_g1_i1:218-1447(-)
MSSSQDTLKKRMTELSEAETFEEARLEWELDNIFWEDETDSCLCGQTIKEVCELKNSKNSNKANVGNCCVKRFLALPSDKIFRGMKSIRKDVGKSLNRECIDFAKLRQILTPDQFEFYQDTLRKRKLTDPQLAQRKRLNEKILSVISGRRKQVEVGKSFLFDVWSGSAGSSSTAGITILDHASNVGWITEWDRNFIKDSNTLPALSERQMEFRERIEKKVKDRIDNGSASSLKRPPDVTGDNGDGDESKKRRFSEPVCEIVPPAISYLSEERIQKALAAGEINDWQKTFYIDLKNRNQLTLSAKQEHKKKEIETKISIGEKNNKTTASSSANSSSGAALSIGSMPAAAGIGSAALKFLPEADVKRAVDTRKINDWEFNFYEDLRKSNPSTLSEKQKLIFDRIEEKIKRY